MATIGNDLIGLQAQVQCSTRNDTLQVFAGYQVNLVQHHHERFFQSRQLVEQFLLGLFNPLDGVENQHQEIGLPGCRKGQIFFFLTHAPHCIRAGCIDHGKQSRIGLLIYRCGARQGTHPGQFAFILYQLVVQGGFADVGRADDGYPVLIAKGLPDLGGG